MMTPRKEPGGPSIDSARIRPGLFYRVQAVLFVAWASACVSPTAEPLDIGAARSAWAGRTALDALEAALSHADVTATSIRQPNPALRTDPSNDAFWEACALAWNPNVRATRGEVLALREDLGSAGAPGPIGFRGVDHEFGGDDPLLETVVTFDLIGLLGLGPSGAARELASARVVRALARHEEALWAARIEVERARVQLSATRARLERLDGLEAEVREDEVRISILARRGREAPATVDAAGARLAFIERQRSVQSAAVAAARRRLEAAAGLPQGHAATDTVSANHVQRFLGEPLCPAASAAAFVGTHPVLRRARFDFSVTEAGVRAMAAEAWPGVRLGPHIALQPTQNLGGILQLSLPWPSAWRGRLAAAERRREAARQAFEDAWLDLDQRASAGARIHELARDRVLGSSLAVDEATQRLWSAARARYRNAKAPLMNWIDALEIRTDALLLIVDDAETLALASLDVLEARGPGSELGSDIDTEMNTGQPGETRP